MRNRSVFIRLSVIAMAVCSVLFCFSACESSTEKKIPDITEKLIDYVDGRELREVTAYNYIQETFLYWGRYGSFEIGSLRHYVSCEEQYDSKYIKQTGSGKNDYFAITLDVDSLPEREMTIPINMRLYAKYDWNATGEYTFQMNVKVFPKSHYIDYHLENDSYFRYFTRENGYIRYIPKNNSWQGSYFRQSNNFSTLEITLYEKKIDIDLDAKKVTYTDRWEHTVQDHARFIREYIYEYEAQRFSIKIEDNDGYRKKEYSCILNLNSCSNSKGSVSDTEMEKALEFLQHYDNALYKSGQLNYVSGLYDANDFTNKVNYDMSKLFAS